MWNYDNLTLQELDIELQKIQKLLDFNPLNAVANAQYKSIVHAIKRKHVEKLTNIKLK